MINFESDYTEGCIPEILEALTRTNTEQTSGYGIDPHCQNAAKLIRKACGNRNVDVHFLVGGTQANLTVIASALKPYQGALCADSGHINVHETGSIEATGHKCLPLPSKDGKITAAQIEKAIVDHRNDGNFEHVVEPGMVYISWPTESGTLYSRKELTEISEVCHKYHVPLFVDGARMGYGLCAKACDVTLADFAKLTDVFYIGGTKVGALFGEAVVIVDKELKKGFRFHMKQRGAMLAKGRMLGIQFEELFKEDRYFKISKNAAECAEMIAKALKKKGYKFAYTPQTNQLFPIMDNEKITELRKEFAFHTFGTVDDTHSIVRFVTSFMTTKENTEKLVNSL
ncbi:MAG: aminotransferase class I/II-fold pyridoxal phosphate-dependent enzyme [Solobacterium sp.]|nr:aminotransferase class I/II-fold pyridoxal phosphate-dependent enzyme [Solobacterium sp.]